MSESKKRSRKSKLEVRIDADIEETENTILQSPDEDYEELLANLKPLFEPQESSSDQHETGSSHQSSTQPSSFFDHTYARFNDQPTPSSSYTRPNNDSASSALQMSVKVEVEEFDESIINDSVSPRLSISQPADMVLKANNKKLIYIFEINIEKMYKISDHINWSSTSLVDKYLSVELKNVWGRVLKPKDDDDPYNMAVQRALHDWGKSFHHGSSQLWKETPLFYQCIICKLAWWYLAPFQNHIRIHDHTAITIYHQQNGHESNIVASDTAINNSCYIPCEGNCYRCGNPYSFHVKQRKQLYHCKKCYKNMATCSLFWLHDIKCISRETLNSYLEKRKHKCQLCSMGYPTYTELDVHMITSHSVRSDIPAPFSFKTCNLCHKKYIYYYTHMCVKSSLNSGCMYCYRKFHRRILQVAHYQAGNEKDYKCKICDMVMPSKCMETEHMLVHTDKFRMVYKCINYACPPMLLFPDEQSIKLHKVLYHFQKYDKRRTYYEKVLIPEQCVKFDYVQIIDSEGDRGDIRMQKIKNFLEPEVVDWCIPKLPDRHKQEEDDDDLIIIKQELEPPINIDSQDDSKDAPMDYAEMLSKVFKMSDAVTPQRKNAEQIHTQIKIEPSDVDFESLIDIKENSITIKQEPIEACLGRSYQNDSCQNGSRNDSCQTSTQNYICQNSSSLTQTDTSDTNIQGDIQIKTEPDDYEIDEVFDSAITAVKMEPEDVKEEIIECTEVNEYVGGNIVTAEDILASPETTNPKIVKTNPNSLLKTNTQKIYIFPPQHTKSLLKKNFIRKMTTEKSPDAQNKTSTKKTKSVLKRMLTDDTSRRSSKPKKAKYDENGLKIKKKYTCSKCGYTDNHRLFRIHQRSFCDQAHSLTSQISKKCVCTKCDTTFASLKAYLVHFTKHGYGILHCPCCNMKFELIKDLIPHFHKHIKLNYVNCWMINDELETTKKQHRCQACRVIVPPELFFTHWESHLKLKEEENEPVELLRERDEKVSSTNEKALQPTTLHLALQQLRSVSREKECLVCCRQFSRRYDVKRHLIEHLLHDAYTKKDKTPTMLLRCQICLEEFSRAEQYKFHMREHGALPVYRCDLCDKTFSDSSNFAKHKKIHNMRVLICDICQKKFHAKSSLEKHIKMHMTTDPIKCDICDRQFFTRSHYNKHLHVRHMRPVRFKCVVCDVSFDSLRNKWDHAWLEHRERKQRADCPICHKKFRKYQDVKSHAKIDHQVELSFFNIKSDAGVMNNVNTFCKIKKTKKRRTIVCDTRLTTL